MADGGFALWPRAVTITELPLPGFSAADERLVVAGELEPQLRAVGGELTVHSWQGTVNGSSMPGGVTRRAGRALLAA